MGRLLTGRRRNRSQAADHDRGNDFRRLRRAAHSRPPGDEHDGQRGDRAPADVCWTSHHASATE